MRITLTFLILIFCTIAMAESSELLTGSYHGIYGKRNFKVYLPKNFSTKVQLPIVVMLHGCQQDADEFAKGTKILKWADKEKFIVLLPEQSITYNPFKCWNWIIPGNNSRFGESEVIIDMIDQVVTKFNADSSRIFAAGMSAGASMVNILGNCYPEKFKALASHDGSQFYSSYYGMDFAEVVLNGANVPAPVSAGLGFTCASASNNRPKKMPIIIFHGMKSPLMSPMHAFQVETEFKILNDLLDNGFSDNSYFQERTVESVPESDRYGYTKYTVIDQDNDVLIERYMINDLSHGWSGGHPNMPYNDPKGPDASALIVKFFKNYGL